VMWVGRTTVFLVGLAVILALVFGVVSRATAHDGFAGLFHLNHNNNATKVSTLTKRGAGPALSVRVDSGAPLRVNSDARVTNLNADKLDGKEAPLLARINPLGFPEDSPDVATTSSTKLRTGVYVVPFNRDVRGCYRVVSLGPGPFNFLNPAATEPPGGEASSANVTNVPEANKKIMVATRNSAGTLTDKHFHLVVFC
jgi:hypothetical protein